MKISKVINQIDDLKPNSYSDEDKILWLSELDGMVKREIIDTHEGEESISFQGYESTADMSTELLVPAPYDSLYLPWLESRIDYYNGEYQKYNNSVEKFNNKYAEYMRVYNREHMPKGCGFKYF